MAVTACEACGGRVNVAAAACPHCGAKRSTATIADTPISKDEIRAMLATSDVSAAEGGRGLAAAMFLPHEQTRGNARNAELVLTVIAAPLVIVGVASFAFARRRFRRAVLRETNGEIAPALAMTLLGGLGMWTLLDALHAPAIALTCISVIAVWARAIIRMRAATSTSRELDRLAGPDDEPNKRAAPARLPAARAVHAPPPGGATVPAPVVERPREEPALPPGDEPRFLR
jgi:hypothetical protein